MKVLTAREMRDVDRLTTERYGVPSLTLMENAGKSVAQFIQQRFPHLERRRIVILCGRGNNGGDGFVVARHLLEMGARPVVFLFAPPGDVRGDAAVNLMRWQGASGEVNVILNEVDWRSSKGPLASAEITVDALLGTGFHGPVEGLLMHVVQDVNRRGPGKFVVAVDIPSGLPADGGDLEGGVVAADHTVSFTAPKLGMLRGLAQQFTGRLVVRDIGSPAELIEEVGEGGIRWLEYGELVSFAIPRRAQGHKGDYGHALIVSGSVGKSGAAVLASQGALRVGAGLVTVATPEPVLPMIAADAPEIMTEPLPATKSGSISVRSIDGGRIEALLKGKRVLAIGPGLSINDETQQVVHTIVGKRMLPTIVDADGLNAFEGIAGELKDAKGQLAVTPHPGEMARLVGCSTSDIQSHRLELAQSAAADWNAFVVLKGHQTVIAAPDGQAWVNSTGNPGMGTAGTGDVLTGMLAGLTAQYGTNSWGKVLSFGVFLHGLAGDIAAAETGEAPLIASDLIQAIPRAYQHFYSECDRG